MPRPASRISWRRGITDRDLGWGMPGNKKFELRLRWMSSHLQQAGYAALVAFGWGSAHGQTTMSHGNMRYLTGWDSQRFSSLLVVFPGGARPVLLVPNIGAYVTAREQIGYCDVRFCAADALGSATAACLAEHAVGRDACVATLGRGEMPVGVWEQLGLQVSQTVDVQYLLDAGRMVKDEDAIGLHRKAAAACDAIFAALPAQLRSGRNLFSIRAQLQALGAMHGAEYCDMWLTASPNAQREFMFKVDMQGVPQDGDQILFGVSLTIDGHWGHAVRAGYMGEPNLRHQFYYDVVRQIYEMAVRELRPGKDLAELNQDMLNVLERHIPDYSNTETYGRFRYAHGLGLSYEDAIVTASFPQPYIAGGRPKSLVAEPGMLVEIHPNIFHVSDGGCALGNMILVTQDGCEALTTHELGLARY